MPYSASRAGFLSRFTGNGSQATQNMAAMGSVGTLFSIVDLMSTSTAAVEWRLWRKSTTGKDEDRVEVTSHLALDVLNNPNPFYSRGELIETGQQHVDLTGECWIVVATNAMGWPESLWPVRPDRIEPVPSAENFLAGYVYTGPDGEKIPLELHQVMRVRMPNPMDPYRGLGPVQSILADADSIRYSVEWNRNFFVNGAEPGGIIQVDKRLSDEEFDEMKARWNEGHRGTSNAHRVAIIEQGSWVDRKFTHNDMQFAELRQVSRDAIREAFKVHAHMLGDSDDVNLANATAAEITFSRRSVLPRVNRWREMLNRYFLPMFGPEARAGLEFDYDNPVEEDESEYSTNFLNRARGAQMLVTSGFDGKLVAEAAGLPEMAWDVGRVVQGSSTLDGVKEQPDNNDQTGWDGQPTDAAPRRILNAAPAPNQPTKPDDVDLTATQEAWVYALGLLLARWASDVTTPQRKALVEQVATIIDGGDLTALASMTVDSAEGTAILHAAMSGLADLAGGHVVQEAARQGVTLTATAADSVQLGEWAGLTADLLALGLRIAAAREAMRVAAPGLRGAEVADQVSQYLAALSDASVRDQLGGALTAAQNAGRIATIGAGPEAALYASEKNDKNTCAPCHEIDGRWLGNVSDMAQVKRTYPSAGYVDCLGGPRCRGTVVAVWRPETTSTGGA